MDGHHQPPGGASDTSSTGGHALLVGGAVLLALLAYSGSFTGAFVFDDLVHVRDQPLVRDLGKLLTWEGFLSLPHRYVGYLTFALNRALLGPGPAGFHAVNFLVHAVNAGLVYALVVLAFRTPRLRASSLATSARPVAFLAAVLFATHPLQTQAVTYIVQRFASLAALFYLLSVVLFLRWRLSREDSAEGAAFGAGRGRAIALHAGVLATALLAMLTKESALTLPVAVVLCEVALFERLPWRRRLFLLPIAATGLAVPLVSLSYIPFSPAGVAAASRMQTSASRWDYLCTQAPVVLTYLRLLIWPAGQNLDHDFPLAQSPLQPRVLVAVLVLGSLAASAIVLLRLARGGASLTAPADADETPGGRSRPGLDPAIRLFSSGIAWFFLALLVESSVIPIADVIYEHRAYLPSAGIFVSLAVAAALVHQRFSAGDPFRFLVVAGVVLALVLGVATFRRNLVWRSDLSLWADAVEKSPAKARPQANYGSAAIAAGRVQEGIPHLRRAIQLDASLTYARAQLGAALLAAGRPAEAEPELREVLRQEPRDPEALFNLAVALSQAGRRAEARPFFERFLEVAPPDYAAARALAERVLR